MLSSTEFGNYVYVISVLIYHCVSCVMQGSVQPHARPLSLLVTTILAYLNFLLCSKLFPNYKYHD